MRLLLSILMFLCVHLLGVPVNAYAGSRASATKGWRVRAVASPVKAQSAPAGISAATDTEKQLSRFDSAEDPDNDDLAGRRQLQLARFVLDASHAFILTCLSNTYRQTLILSPQPLFSGTAKYIAQRVLRL